MDLVLEKDQHLMKNNIENERVVVELRLSTEESHRRDLETKKLKQEHANGIKMAEQELEKNNMGDENMLRHKACQLAKKCYSGKYITEATITSMAKNDPSTAVIAGMLAQYDTVKKAVG